MREKPVVWLGNEIKTPPFSQSARLDAGYYLRMLQDGELPGMPRCRPMPEIWKRCHELRIPDPESDKTWRIIFRLDPDAIVIGETFAKKKTPGKVIRVCQKRFKQYDSITAM